ncbi:unnamed protein product [Spirodela intermedia]|uniref:Bromo domain-containing protein n=1 Tax=Spirodela intermedia TaxID=51605 RepID=A0A7I8JFH9_SPIIN|nr:unnamed protein product [Spirodela intermedia]CAA6668691.1 unnamed protein product [Spirodela intermedia]
MKPHYENKFFHLSSEREREREREREKERKRDSLHVSDIETAGEILRRSAISLLQVFGSPSFTISPVSTPLPEKKTLEDVLDKLQKKDIYGVYAEPVDPEELPDYHDIIKHPMDFGTIRKKLADGAYSDLEKFESDVFLVCTNAMQYNAPDTIYFRQAHSIQELARKKFQSIRLGREEVIKSEGKNQPNSTRKNLIAGSLDDEDAHHPARALVSNGDISSGGLVTLETRVREQPASISGNMDGSSTCESKSIRGEDNSGKIASNSFYYGRWWRPVLPEGKPDAFYEDCRATYNPPVEPRVIGSHLPFSIFDNEQMYLIAVGLEGGQHTYARSLARFAGPLGPTAWRIASQRIERVLPEGVGFGPGWVGEYEPLHQGPPFLNKAENQRESLMVDEAGPIKSGLSNGRFPVGPTIMQVVNSRGDVPEVGSAGCGPLDGARDDGLALT